MAQQLKRKLVVCGGNGFLGSQICRSAVNRGWTVTALSRSGIPSALSSTPWAQKVEWARADVFDPSTYSSHLQDADAVVHSLGVLLESDYKPLLRGGGNSTGLLSSLANLVTPKVANTMSGPQPAESQEQKPKLTYERMNTESVLTFAQAVIDAQKDSSKPRTPFVYISAAGSFPLLPAGYLNTKRATETHLQTPQFSEHLQPLFFRPGYMTPAEFSPTDPRSLVSIPIATGSYFASMIDDTIGRGKLASILGEGSTTKAMPVDQVGNAVVELLESTLSGAESTPREDPVVDAREISQLAALSWRKNLA